MTMRKVFRYSNPQIWFKGNTHIHSTISDGGLPFPEIERLYVSAGYQFLFATDHGKPSSFPPQQVEVPFLWLNGVEFDGFDQDGALFHVVCLGDLANIALKIPIQEALQLAHEQEAILILAHPFWSGNTFTDTQKFPFLGVEVYNHVCHWINGKGEGRVHWNAMLCNKPNTLCFAADDAHLRSEHPGWNGGWIMVNSPRLSTASIFQSIRQGNFYASCGPQFNTLVSHKQTVHVTTSPVQFIRLVGPRDTGMRVGSFDGSLVQEAVFTVPEQWKYAYIEIEDINGKRAWTNTLFV
jgi:hypothetical protein